MNLAFPPSPHCKLAPHQNVLRSEQQSRGWLAMRIESLRRLRILIQHDLRAIAFCTGVIIHDEESQTRLVQATLVVRAENVSVDDNPLRRVLARQRNGALGIALTDGLLGHTHELHLLVDDPLRNRFRRLRHGEDRASPNVLPGLRQCQAAHGMPGPDADTRIAADQELSRRLHLFRNIPFLSLLMNRDRRYRNRGNLNASSAAGLSSPPRSHRPHPARSFRETWAG